LKKVFFILLGVWLMAGCERSEVEVLQNRLDNFRNILPQELRERFDSKDYPAVTTGIDSLLRTEPDFKKEYERLKHEELIDVFSSEEVVDFFREYFVEEIERLKQSKEGTW
jgi:hypothetical protein